MLTLDEYIAIGTAAATFVTALATLLTVREIARQRKAALKPDLISVHQYGYVYVEHPPTGMRYFWRNEKTAMPQLIQQSRYGIAVLNVGSGAAKQVCSEWTLDLESLVTRINALAGRAEVAVSVNFDAESKEVRILWPDKVIGTHLVANQLAHEHGHILPASLDKAGLEMEVPAAFLTLTALQVALGLVCRQHVANREDWGTWPDAGLLLTYRDVLGEKHAKKLKLSLDLLSAGHENVGHHAGELPTFMQFAVKLDEL